MPPPPATPSQEQVTGLIDRVTFHSPETGFAVLRVEVRGHRDPVTVVGPTPAVRAGEWLDATGRWTVDPTHGQQFRADVLRTVQPQTAEGMAKYLGSGLVKGVGPTLAQRLVDTFGLAVVEAIEQTPQQLLSVPGIGKGRQKKIVTAWTDQKVVRGIMVFLHSHGVGTGRAFRIFKTYGEQAIERVREVPYRPARDIRGIGFKTADAIAATLGIGKQSDLRARAGVEFVLQELTEAGHVAFPRAGLVHKAVQMLEIPPDVIEAAVDHGTAEGRLVQGQVRDGEPLVYLAPLDHAERSLAENLLALSRGAHPCPPIEIDKAVAWVEGRIGSPLAAAQREALGLAVRSKVVVITGGPGVGKTTLLRAVVEVLRAKQMRLVLCAPTGRAAKRLGEATGVPATTIHRLLEFDPKTGGFKHDRDHPLDGDVFVVDETSMVDVVLAHQTVRAVPPHAALVLVGDVDQLPPVGPGSVLRDVIDSGAVPVCRLTEVFRQAAESRIVANAHRVNRGLMPVFPPPAGEGQAPADFYFVAAEEPEAAADAVLRLVRDHIPRRLGLRPLDDVQVLCPMQRGTVGARSPEPEPRPAAGPEPGRPERRAVRVDVPGGGQGDADEQRLRQGRVQWGHRPGDGTGRGGAGTGRDVRGAGRRVRLQRTGRVGPELRDDGPQEPGQRVPGGRDPGAHPALPDAPAEPAVHGDDPRQAAGRARGDEEGGGGGGEADGPDPAGHDPAGAAGRRGRPDHAGRPNGPRADPLTGGG
ncbi:MAG: recD2, partial [Phycisphaerales bacterium]|nr:recD2 [Phycisphaerales bacterium]